MTSLPTSIETTINTKNGKGKTLLKIVGTVAIVGTLAALACLGLGGFQNKNSVNLASTVDPEVQQAYTDFMSRYSKSYLTKEEYNARLSNFRNTYQEVKLHNANNDSSFKLGLN